MSGVGVHFSQVAIRKERKKNANLGDEVAGILNSFE